MSKISMAYVKVLLDNEMIKNRLFPQKDESKYAVPLYSSYSDYDELFREYEIVAGYIYTVMIRKFNDKYWVRCGYKNSSNSKVVEGIENRDYESYDLDEIFKHCRNHYEILLNELIL